MLIGWLKRKECGKIPRTPELLTNFIKTDARSKLDPSRVEHLTKKEKTEDKIASYLELTIEQLAEYTDDEGGQMEAAIGFLSFFGAAEEFTEKSVDGGLILGLDV